MQHFAILGNNTNISLLELESVLHFFDIAFEVDYLNPPVVIFSTLGDIPYEKIMERLGGTIKIGMVIGEAKNEKELEKLLKSHFSFADTKVFYGFSIYTQNFSKGGVEKVGISLKKHLKDYSVSARMVTSKEPILSSVIVKKNKLLRRGADFCLMGEKDIFVGVTKSVQEFEFFGDRDFGRPGRDDVSGMLPPKLARMMVNISEAPREGRVLDPFCGSGTVLQEALLLGYTRVIGSDLEERAVLDTKENLSWLSEKYDIDISGIEVLKSPAESIAEKISHTIDAVVTEPFLGPPLKGNETKERLLKNKKMLEDVYVRAIAQMGKLITQDGVVVIVIPVFKYKDEFIFLDVLDAFKQNGFEVHIPKQFKTDSKFRTPLMYFREGQKVYREIWRFKKV